MQVFQKKQMKIFETLHLKRRISMKKRKQKYMTQCSIPTRKRSFDRKKFTLIELCRNCHYRHSCGDSSSGPELGTKQGADDQMHRKPQADRDDVS